MHGPIQPHHSDSSPSQTHKSKETRNREVGEVSLGVGLGLIIGRIDIWGNDRYLRHVHRETLRHVRPVATHEVVLGDLFGSQWIKDDEFVSRVHRYENIIFKDVVPQRILIVEVRGTIIRGGQVYEYHWQP